MSPRRLTATALFLLATSALAVPACEVDSTRPRGGTPVLVHQTTPPASPAA